MEAQRNENYEGTFDEEQEVCPDCGAVDSIIAG
jgi:hypothetical protein